MTDVADVAATPEAPAPKGVTGKLRAVFANGAPLFPLVVLFALNAVDQADQRAFALLAPNIRDHFQWIGHFHTGGNPGRKEIDETQELNYRFIMKAIADLGYGGFVTHEYSPTQGNDPIAVLAKAMEICDA